MYQYRSIMKSCMCTPLDYTQVDFNLIKLFIYCMYMYKAFFGRYLHGFIVGV